MDRFIFANFFEMKACTMKM